MSAYPVLHASHAPSAPPSHPPDSRRRRAAGAQLLGQLASRALAALPEFAPQHVSVLLWAYAKLDTSPGQSLLGGAAAAALAAMPRFNPQNMANTLWAYATLGHYPGAALLDAAAERQLALMQARPTCPLQAMLWLPHDHCMPTHSTWKPRRVTLCQLLHASGRVHGAEL